MVTMTLAVPDDLKRKMDRFPEMNWSEVARQAFTKRVEQMAILKKFARESEMTEEDAVRLGRELKRGALKRHR